MKKTALRLLSAAMALIIVLSLSGCGPVAAILANAAPTPSPTPEPTVSPTSTPEPTSTPAPDSSSESSSSSKAPSSGAAADGMYATVREFLVDNRETLSETIDQMTSTMDDMSVSLEGTTDRLIYNFVFAESATEGVDEAALISALEGGLDDESFTSIFENIADSIKEVVAVDTVKVDIIYSKADGTELVHRTYTSSSVSEDTPASTGSAAYSTVRAYLDDNRESLNDMLSEIAEDSDEISSMVLDATDDTLIYKLTLDEDAISGLDESQISAALNAGLNNETMVEYFRSLVTVIKSSTKLDTAKVRIVYSKADGTVLASKEYTSK